ncbi:MAG: hypothetical protein HZB68_03585 [Candidatus Aenigmarchaeota archaeon]|nr:hypothetical protein [Candidatus Aenigmarchaeota archaeon]
MRLLALLAIFVIGCVSIESLKALVVGEPIYNKVELLNINVEAFPSVVEGGKRTSIVLTASNNGNTTLENVKVEVTDPCTLKFDTSSFSKDKIEPARFESWEWKASTSPVDIRRDCKVRYTLSYDSTAFIFYDISAISEDEYSRLLKSKTLEKEIQLKQVKTKTPIDIQISVNKEQPLISGTEFLFYVQLIDTGVGEPELKELKIKYPDYLTLVECDDLQGSNGALTLKGKLDFLERKTKRMTCKFSVNKDIVIKEIRPFEGSATYKYSQTNEVNIQVVPK